MADKPAVVLAKAVVVAIEAAKAAKSFSHNLFLVKRSYQPAVDLSGLSEGGTVWVVGLSPGDEIPYTRSRAVTRELAVQVAFQVPVEPEDIDQADIFSNFLEELRDVCRLNVTTAGYHFVRIEAMKDEETGLPYYLEGMRKGIFEGYFTVFYNTQT